MKTFLDIKKQKECFVEKPPGRRKIIPDGNMDQPKGRKNNTNLTRINI